MNPVDMKKQLLRIGDAFRKNSVNLATLQDTTFTVCLSAVREIDCLREALATAQNYLSKVDTYREDIADEADYFCKVTITNLLKSGSEKNESDGK